MTPNSHGVEPSWRSSTGALGTQVVQRLPEELPRPGEPARARGQARSLIWRREHDEAPNVRHRSPRQHAAREEAAHAVGHEVEAVAGRRDAACVRFERATSAITPYRTTRIVPVVDLISRVDPARSPGEPSISRFAPGRERG